MRDRLAIALLIVGCGPVVDAADMGSGDSSTAPSNTDAVDVAHGDDDGDQGEGVAEPDEDSGGAPGPTTDDVDGTGSSSGDPGVDCQFLCAPDFGGSLIECDVWTQDCPYGEKCTPWGNDGGNYWNATKCVPVDPMPGDLGDPCTVEGSAVSGIDDCKLGAMCWSVDPDTNMGECVGLCIGSEANPTCEDPNADCVIGGDSVLTICIPRCDPLLQNCDAGDACYPINDGFSCVVDDSGDAGVYGDACSFLNVCDAGLFCANPEHVPGCEGEVGCCTPYCDLEDANASANCPGVAGGQECVPWYEDGQAPPGMENVGACLIPT